MSKGQNQSRIVAKCTRRKTAAAKYVTGDITVRQKTYTPQAIEDAYQKPIDTRTALTTARGAVATALQARRDADAGMETTDEVVETWVDATYGLDSQAAVDFGYAKKRRAKVPVAEKAQAAARAKATREALGTRGSKQKKDAKRKLAEQPPAPPSETTPSGK